MAHLRLVGVQTWFQIRSTARNRRAVVFSVIFPVVLLVMFNSIFTRGDEHVDLAGARVTAHAYFTGGMLTYAILLSGFSHLAISLVGQRSRASSSAFGERRYRRGRSSPRPWPARS